jgi:hypothetical protein
MGADPMSRFLPDEFTADMLSNAETWQLIQWYGAIRFDQGLKRDPYHRAADQTLLEDEIDKRIAS